MAISVFDLFKLGIGPSSSHTVGPMRAARAFARQVADHAEAAYVDRLQVNLFGSLAATGIGHATDRAVIMGLMGHAPDTVDPHAVAPALAALAQSRTLTVPGLGVITFDPDSDLTFELTALPFHPNGMRFSALAGENTVLTRQYYSVGGGFIVSDEIATAGVPPAPEAGVTYPFESATELLGLCAQHDLSISELMMINESAWAKPADITAALMRIWEAMDACIANGLANDGVLPGGLKVRRRALRLHNALQPAPASSAASRIVPGLAALDWINLYALAVNEENAAGGRVVTAPTNGAAGIVPAVLKYHLTFNPEAEAQDIPKFLLAAAAVGILCKTNASISGAEVGCQGEVGSACAMAAAGLAQVLGGSPAQVENAAEIALEHNLGLTCDPIGGLVQIPCIERNAIAAVKAVNAAQMALRQDGNHFVSLDQVIRTMRDTGRDMSHKYKETSLGGLAVSLVEC
jgi:L-serine dehydratase